MPTAANCRSRAEEAERLAQLVSYERDRTRLMRQAKAWREKADALDAEAASGAAPEPEPTDAAPTGVSRLRRWLGLR